MVRRILAQDVRFITPKPRWSMGSVVRFSDWVAYAAFCISLTALVSNLTLIWLRWPRIVVEVAPGHHGRVVDESRCTEGDWAGDVFLLTVINNGSEPVTLTGVGLTRSGRDAHRLDYLDTWRGRPPACFPRCMARSRIW